ncbi:laccase 2 precursor [Mycena metata]|uniref:Laccase 2 n=1 Tax=Mycena metata TaxID=1033252 RepID=A0AAD7HA35_9AGAR|nr:laccase 2 precursor [Mycena metata]
MRLSPSILTLAISLLSSSLAATIGPVGNLPIVNKQIAPDGFSRSGLSFTWASITVLAGGTFPGPLIAANKGDKFSLNVEDQLTDPTMLRSTSIHWHGLFQRNSSWADGPSFVNRRMSNRCKSLVLYEFQAPGQTGTYWYHSHLSTQYFRVSATTVITLADWYHFTAPSAPALARANSTLINGLGRYQNGLVSELAVISVKKGSRYRFRLVSISCDPNFIFSIDGHDMTIIEVDGVSHKPLTVDSIQIFAGQRYSVVINANQAVGNYWIRANPNIGLATGFAGGINSAILRYVRAAVAEPTTNSISTNPLIENNLHPLTPAIGPVPGKPFPGGADVNLNLNIALNATSFRFSINGAILSGAQAAQDLLPVGSVYTLPPNKVIEISIPGGSPGAPHPFHLHGHNFHVIRSAGNDSYNFVDPVIRDVVSTGPAATDNTTFRFVTDNAGPWFLHCHIDWHFEIGLAIVFAEDAGTIKHEPVPAAWDQLCPIYDNLTPSQL